MWRLQVSALSLTLLIIFLPQLIMASPDGHNPAFVRTPLLPSSRAFRLDNTLASNAYEEPLQSVSVVDPYNFPYDLVDSRVPTDKEQFRPQNRYRAQLQNQPPRYRTMSQGGIPYLGSKRLNVNPTPHQRAARHNSELIQPSPFISNSSQQQQSYLSNELRPLGLVRPLNNFRDSQFFWLWLYFAFNLSLTLFNKGVLLQFPFPYTLTALHALCGSIGGYVLLENGVFVRARLGIKENVALVAFSVLYAINIVVSNMSLHLVTIPVRANVISRIVSIIL
jgi:hypothetical protein